MNRRDNLSEWHRRVAVDMAAACPLETADDPRLAEEAQRIEADLARDANKGERLSRQNDARAVQLQQQHFDALRRAGVL